MEVSAGEVSLGTPLAVCPLEHAAGAAHGGVLSGDGGSTLTCGGLFPRAVLRWLFVLRKESRMVTSQCSHGGEKRE